MITEELDAASSGIRKGGVGLKQDFQNVGT